MEREGEREREYLQFLVIETRPVIPKLATLRTEISLLTVRFHYIKVKVKLPLCFN
jgi:hypothetical protein